MIRRLLRVPWATLGLGVLMMGVLVFGAPLQALAHPAGPTSCDPGSDPHCSCDALVGGKGIGCEITGHENPHPGDGGGGGGGGGGGDGGGGGGGDDPGPPPEVCTIADVYYLYPQPRNGELWGNGRVECTPTGRVFARIDVCLTCSTPFGPNPPPPPGPVADPVSMRTTVAAAVVPLPPPAVVQPEEPVVGMPAFLQVEGFTSRSATGSGGGIVVEVTATPVGVVWDFDGDERRCSSAGAPYTRERLQRALAAPDGAVDDGVVCTHLFIDASSVSHGGPIPSSVVTVWDYSWSLNGVPQGVFNAGVISPPTTFDLTVREFQPVGR